MRNKQLPAWAVPGLKIVYSIGYSDRVNIETITRVTATSAWSANDDYAVGSPNRRETRWTSDGSYNEPLLERYGGSTYRYTFAYPLESARGRTLLARAQKADARREINELMSSWQKEQSADNSMKLRQALARWEIKFAPTVEV